MMHPRNASPVVLITGFGPFPGARFNPTAELVRRLVRLQRPGLAGVRRIGHIFRTSYAAVEAELPALIGKHQPDVVLMFGLAARTPYIRIETCARNTRASLLADAAGRTPSLRSIAPGGPPFANGRATFVPLVVAVSALGLPVRLSDNAGRYLCNFAYWRALETAVAQVLFVHVPKVRMTVRPRRNRTRRAFTEIELTRAGEVIVLKLASAAQKGRGRGSPVPS
jgi:pyroglutamyl-peptidase